MSHPDPTRTYEEDEINWRLKHMKFIREIPEKNITDFEINRLDQFGFTLVYTQDSVEVWAEGARS